MRIIYPSILLDSWSFSLNPDRVIYSNCIILGKRFSPSTKSWKYTYFFRAIRDPYFEDSHVLTLSAQTDWFGAGIMLDLESKLFCKSRLFSNLIFWFRFENWVRLWNWFLLCVYYTYIFQPKKKKPKKKEEKRISFNPIIAHQVYLPQLKELNILKTNI